MISVVEEIIYIQLFLCFVAPFGPLRLVVTIRIWHDCVDWLTHLSDQLFDWQITCRMGGDSQFTANVEVLRHDVVCVCVCVCVCDE